MPLLNKQRQHTYQANAPVYPSTRRWIRTNVILGLLATPIVIWAYWRLQADATAVITIPLATLRWLPLLFGVGQYLATPWSTIFAVMTGLGILAAVVHSLASKQSARALWLVITLTFPIVLLLLMTLIKAKWSERYLLPSWGVALVIAVGSGWESLLQFRGKSTRSGPNAKSLATRPPLAYILNTAGALLVIAWFILVAPALAYQAAGTHAVAIRDEWHPRPDFRGVARYIEAHNDPSDVIVVVGGYAASTLDYYYQGPAKLFGIPFDTRVLDTQNVVDLNTLEILEREAVEAENLWLVLWQEHLADPTSIVQTTLIETCQRLPVYTGFTNIGLLYFNIRDCRPLDQLATPRFPLDVSFSVPIELEGFDLIQSAGLWEVDLWWHSHGQLTENYTVFVHLVSPDGLILSQHDHIAGSDTYPTSMWREDTRLRDRFFLEMPNNVDPRSYLNIGLYTDTGRVLLTDGNDALKLDLAQFHLNDSIP